MNNIPKRKLIDNIKQVVKKSLTKFWLIHDQKDICGYALCSDSDASSVILSINLKAHLNKMVNDDPDDAIYYKWSPSEWAYESIEEGETNHLSKELYEASKEKSFQTDYYQYRLNVFNSCVQALCELKNESFFKLVDNNPLFVFTVSDTELPKEEIEWIKQLNSDKEAKEFIKWLTTLC